VTPQKNGKGRKLDEKMSSPEHLKEGTPGYKTEEEK
jgi:hypothetical protein